jgi:hypothetical protein
MEVIITWSDNKLAEPFLVLLKGVLISMVCVTIAFLPLIYAFYEVSYTYVQNICLYLFDNGIIPMLFWCLFLVAGYDITQSVILPFFTGREQKKQAVSEAAMHSAEEDDDRQEQKFTGGNSRVIFDFVGRPS